jgi:hypothetical protein
VLDRQRTDAPIPRHHGEGAQRRAAHVGHVDRPRAGEHPLDLVGRQHLAAGHVEAVVVRRRGRWRCGARARRRRDLHEQRAVRRDQPHRAGHRHGDARDQRLPGRAAERELVERDAQRVGRHLGIRHVAGRRADDQLRPTSSSRAT